MKFGQRFKELRIEKKLKQQELADDFNKIYGHTFSKSSISQYENGKRTPETQALKNFALYFNVSIDYLLGISDDKYIKNEDEEIDLPTLVLNCTNNFFEDENISRDKKDKMFKEISKLYFDSLQ